MIRILSRDHLHAPVVVCDVCGDPIWDANDGVAVFNAVLKEMEKTDVLHAHKGDCHDAAEDRIGEHAGWQELSSHFYWLGANLEITPEQFVKLSRLHKDGF
jgi:hypothetical protein